MNYKSKFTGQQIDQGIDKANSAYQKPQTGIPASDLSEDVQSSVTQAQEAAKSAQQASTNAEDAVTKANNAVSDANNALQFLTTMEGTVNTAEQGRKDAESERVTAENARVAAENKRAQSEQSREEAETNRANAEKARVAAETARVTAEQGRVTAEQGRVEVETERVKTETAREQAEQGRVTAENARKTAESARVAAETSRDTAEAKRALAETERQSAEDARKAAEQKRESAFESSKSAADTAVSNANAAAEKANTEAEKAKAVVEDYKQNAHEHLTIILTTDNDNDVALKGAVVSIKYQNPDMETARLTWDGEPLKMDITAGMVYTVSTSNVSGYDYVPSLKNITAIGGYNRSVTLRYANAMDKEEAGQIYINPFSGSATLHRENVETLNASLAEYRSKGFPCVMDAGGKMMAKIKSATFEGNEGTVTFMDGTICDISALNEKGCNWMVYRPELFFNSWVDKTGNEILSFGGNLKVTGGHSFREKFVGMFKAYVQKGVLKSQPNRIPTGNQTIATFQAQAEAGGAGYTQWSYKDWCKEIALHISLFGNTNLETNIGVGRINNYDNVRNIVTGFTLPLVGTEHNYGTRATVDSAGSAVNCLNFLDMEGLGEQIWEFVIGYRHDASTIYIWDDDTWSESHNADYTVPYSINNAYQSYVRQMVAGEHFDMIPRLVGGSSVTGYCDGYWANTGGRLLCVGGAADSGSFCGLSASYSDAGFGFAVGLLGARLAFSGRPVEVEGSKLLE